MLPPTRSGLTASCQSRLLLLIVALMAAVAVMSAPTSATDTSAGTAIDHHTSPASGMDSTDDTVAVGDQRFDGTNDEGDDDEQQQQQQQDIDGRRLAELFGVQMEDNDVQDEIEKRRSKSASFRSDLGKRGHNDDMDDIFSIAEKRAYRMRGGKAFKADLGKRARGASMFRSDLGRRSDPSLVSDPRRLTTGSGRAFDGFTLGNFASLSAAGEFPGEREGEAFDVSRRRSMFRSDLGKRSTKAESVRRMFRADLGKRRIAFRHDLG